MLIDNKRRCLNGYSYQDVQINYSVELITTIPDWLLHLQKVITQTIIPDWLLHLQKVAESNNARHNHNPTDWFQCRRD